MPWDLTEGTNGGLYTSTAIQVNRTYHVVSVMSGDTGGTTGTLTGYLNGVQFGQVNGVGQLFAHPGDISIGAYRNDSRFDNGTVSGNGDNFNGIIDEVALYNTALSATTVSNHFSQGYGVLTNDSDPEGNPIQAVLDTNPSNGTLALNSDGSFTYTPDPNFFGTDSFDFSQNGNVATVTSNVIGTPDPPNIVDASVAINENSPNGSLAFDVNDGTDDFDADGDALTYSITAGNGAGGFAINGANGQITVANSSVLDFETTTQFVLTVEADDGTNTDTADITIDLNNLNDNDPNITDATVAIDENTANSTLVFDVNDGSDDFDADGDALTYSITAGNGAGGFAFNGANGQITVANSSVLDFETTTQFVLTVEADVGTNTDTADITIDLNDVNERPVAFDATLAIDEGLPVGSSIHTVAANDVDAGVNGLLTYAIVAGNTEGAFAIEGSNGEITVANSAALDFNANPSFVLTVRVTDGGGLFENAIVIVNLINPNPIPTPPPKGEPVEELPPIEIPAVPEEPPIDPPAKEDEPPDPFEDGDVTEPPAPDPVPQPSDPPVNTVVPPEAPGEPGDKPIETPKESEKEATTPDPPSETVKTEESPKTEEQPVEVVGAFEEIEKAFSTDLLFQQLDSFNDEFDTAGSQHIGAGLAASLTAALTAGYVVWTIRGGYLLSSLLASMPAWTLIDPMPVLNAGVGPDDKKKSQSKSNGKGESQTTNNTLDTFLE